MIDVICGQGRLGKRVAALLAQQQRPLLPMRIDAGLGLVNPGLLNPGVVNSAPLNPQQASLLPAVIELLLICLVPRHPEGGSGWAGLLDGLAMQVERGELHIKRALLVSSTAVYESHAHGWVSADSPVVAASARSAGLIAAEQRLRQLSPDSCIVRLAGICGAGYERYDPVAMSSEQPRHAVEVQAAAACIASLALRSDSKARTELVTDGYIYYQQQRYPAAADHAKLQALAAQHRLLLPSIIARTGEV